MGSTKYFVNDKTRMCRVVSGPGMQEEAVSDGYREVSQSDLDAFRLVTQMALGAGWKPGSTSYAKFLAKHPTLSTN